MLKNTGGLQFLLTDSHPACPAVHVAPWKAYFPARHSRSSIFKGTSICPVRLGMSLLGEAERTEVSAQGEKPPHNSIGLNTSFANFGGVLSSECAEDERARLGCPASETLMLSGTPALRSPWTLLAPGLHLATFHTIIELCVLERISKVTETGDYVNHDVFPSLIFKYLDLDICI